VNNAGGDVEVVRSENIGRYGMDKRNPERDKAARQHFQELYYGTSYDTYFDMSSF